LHEAGLTARPDSLRVRLIWTGPTGRTNDQTGRFSLLYGDHVLHVIGTCSQARLTEIAE
jgi:hypothetical protein